MLRSGELVNTDTVLTDVILCIMGVVLYQSFNRTDYYFWLVVPITTTAARI